MRLGGHLSPQDQVLDAVLLIANAGITEFQFSRAFKRFEGTAPAPYVRAMNVKLRGQRR